MRWSELVPWRRRNQTGPEDCLRELQRLEAGQEAELKRIEAIEARRRGWLAEGAASPTSDRRRALAQRVLAADRVLAAHRRALEDASAWIGRLTELLAELEGGTLEPPQARRLPALARELAMARLRREEVALAADGALEAMRPLEPGTEGEVQAVLDLMALGTADGRESPARKPRPDWAVEEREGPP